MKTSACEAPQTRACPSLSCIPEHLTLNSESQQCRAGLAALTQVSPAVPIRPQQGTAGSGPFGQNRLPDSRL